MAEIELNAAESALADLMGRLGQEEEQQTLEDLVTAALGPEVSMPFVEALADAMLAYQAQHTREKDVRHAVVALWLKGVRLVPQKDAARNTGLATGKHNDYTSPALSAHED